MLFNKNKRKRSHNNTVQIPGGLDQDSNIPAVALFGDSNMAAATSFKNQEYNDLPLLT